MVKFKLKVKYLFQQNFDQMMRIKHLRDFRHNRNAQLVQANFLGMINIFPEQLVY